MISHPKDANTLNPNFPLVSSLEILTSEGQREFSMHRLTRPLFLRNTERGCFVIQELFLVSLVLGASQEGLSAKATGPQSAPLFSLEDYFSEVVEKHEGLQALRDSSQAKQRRLSEPSLLFWPALEANAAYSLNDRDSPLTQIDRQKNQVYSLGVLEKTPLGVNAALRYKLSYSRFETLGGARPLIEYWDSFPSLEVSVSLWRDLGGRESRAQVDAARRAVKAESYLEKFQAKQVLAQAETLYFKLAAARMLKEISQDVIRRAQELYRWAKEKEDLQLADKSDRLQAEALLRLRELDFARLESQLKEVSRAFNSLRGIDSDQVGLRVDVLRDEPIHVPAKKVRDDVLAALESSKAREAQAREAYQRNLPTTEVFGSYAWGRGKSQASQAFESSFSRDEREYTLGLKFSMPLNVFLSSQVRAAYSREERASAKIYERKLFEQESDWKRLLASFEDAQERLRLHKLLENVQKEKLDAQRKQLQRARTTMFQVIQAELDYADARVQRVSAQALVHELVAQMKVYGDAYEPR